MPHGRLKVVVYAEGHLEIETPVNIRKNSIQKLPLCAVCLFRRYGE